MVFSVTDTLVDAPIYDRLRDFAPNVEQHKVMLFFSNIGR